MHSSGCVTLELQVALVKSIFGSIGRVGTCPVKLRHRVPDKYQTNIGIFPGLSARNASGTVTGAQECRRLKRPEGFTVVELLSLLIVIVQYLQNTEADSEGCVRGARTPLYMARKNLYSILII